MNHSRRKQGFVLAYPLRQIRLFYRTHCIFEIINRLSSSSLIIGADQNPLIIDFYYSAFICRDILKILLRQNNFDLKRIRSLFFYTETNCQIMQKVILRMTYYDGGIP